MINNEIWKDVKGYEGLYKISNFGRIKNRFNTISTGWNRGLGYRKTRLYKNKKHTNFYIHRLVALHFIPNPENKPIINHIDNNPSNNKSYNLEWCTCKENVEHSVKQNRMKGAPRLVINTQSGIFYESIIEASKTINMPANGLVCRLIGRTYNNTYFIYADL